MDESTYNASALDPYSTSVPIAAASAKKPTAAAPQCKVVERKEVQRMGQKLKTRRQPKIGTIYASSIALKSNFSGDLLMGTRSEQQSFRKKLKSYNNGTLKSSLVKIVHPCEFKDVKKIFISYIKLCAEKYKYNSGLQKVYHLLSSVDNKKLNEFKRPQVVLIELWKETV